MLNCKTYFILEILDISINPTCIENSKKQQNLHKIRHSKTITI